MYRGTAKSSEDAIEMRSIRRFDRMQKNPASAEFRILRDTDDCARAEHYSKATRRRVAAKEKRRKASWDCAGNETCKLKQLAVSVVLWVLQWKLEGTVWLIGIEMERADRSRRGAGLQLRWLNYIVTYKSAGRIQGLCRYILGDLEPKERSFWKAGSYCMHRRWDKVNGSA
ncbi:hypothetical protein C8J57DRAFT_1245545 [Mycena rebaudengoi]|nr:hypothetical protein C8J57DRAFT_1245545 [Mycena rebaudengoi]